MSRYREERLHGLAKAEAIARAGATATRTVLFSGMTVVLALVGMLLVPSNVFIALGLGAILVVIAAVFASMTLLPAVLSLLGDRVNKLTIPWIGRAAVRFDKSRPGGFWDWVSRGVMKQPVISPLLARGFLILDREFSAGEVTPAEIVIYRDIDSPLVQSGIEDLKAQLALNNAFSEARPLQVNDDRDLALLSVPVAGDSASDEALDAVKRLRNQYVPAAFGDVPAEVFVAGETAINIDFFNLANNAAFVVIPFVLGISFLLTDGGLSLHHCANQGHHPEHPVGGGDLRNPGPHLPSKAF